MTSTAVRHHGTERSTGSSRAETVRAGNPPAFQRPLPWILAAQQQVRGSGRRPGEARLRLPERLRERKIVQWMLGYLAVAWMALQMTDALREIWSWPIELQRAVTLALGLGILPTAVIAWYHGERGRQKVCASEMTIVSLMVVVLGWVIWCICV